MQLSQPTCHYILWSKYFPQQPILRHPQSMFLPHCQTPSCIPVQNKIIALYNLNFMLFNNRWEDKKVLDSMVASIIRFQSPLNFCLNRFWFVTVIPKYLKCVTFSDDLFAIFMSQFSPAFWWWDTNIYFIFSTFIFGPISFLELIEVLCFYL
jgi:hypothetical protein